MPRFTSFVQQPSLDTPKSRSVVHVLTSSSSGGNSDRCSPVIMIDNSASPVEDRPFFLSAEDSSDAPEPYPMPMSVNRRLGLKKVIRKSIGGLKRAFHKLNCSRGDPEAVAPEYNDYHHSYRPKQHFVKGPAFPSTSLEQDTFATTTEIEFFNHQPKLLAPSMADSFETRSNSTEETPPQNIFCHQYDPTPSSSVAPKLPLLKTVNCDRQLLGPSVSYDDSCWDLDRELDFPTTGPLRSERPSCSIDDGDDQPNAMPFGFSNLGNSQDFDAMPIINQDSGVVLGAPTTTTTTTAPPKKSHKTIPFRKLRWQLIKLRLALSDRSTENNNNDMDGLFCRRGEDDDFDQHVIDFSPLDVEVAVAA